MVSSATMSVLAAAMLLSLTSAQGSSVQQIPTPTQSVALNAQTTIGCFATGAPLDNHGPFLYQSPGNCQPICVLLKKPVMGVSDGENCWCGDLLPPENTKVDDNSCDTPCRGIDSMKCGGNKKLMVMLTGLTKNKVDHLDPKLLPSSSESAPSIAPTRAPANTVVVTASNAATSGAAAAPKDNRPNVAGIAAGVVVGVVGLAAIIGGVFFWLRNKRRRDVEEEYRRQAAASDFVSGNKLHTSASSMTDSRLDPEFMARRASNGSIADNEDYSRRILKVTNPDGR